MVKTSRFPSVPELLNDHVDCGNAFVLINLALHGVQKRPGPDAWRDADALISRISSEALEASKWWHELAVAGEEEGHLVLWWLARHDKAEDPDGMEPRNRLGLVDEGRRRTRGVTLFTYYAGRPMATLAVYWQNSRSPPADAPYAEHRKLGVTLILEARDMNQAVQAHVATPRPRSSPASWRPARRPTCPHSSRRARSGGEWRFNLVATAEKAKGPRVSVLSRKFDGCGGGI